MTDRRNRVSPSSTPHSDLADFNRDGALPQGRIVIPYSTRSEPTRLDSGRAAEYTASPAVTSHEVQPRDKRGRFGRKNPDNASGSKTPTQPVFDLDNNEYDRLLSLEYIRRKSNRPDAPQTRSLSLATKADQAKEPIGSSSITESGFLTSDQSTIRRLSPEKSGTPTGTPIIWTGIPGKESPQKRTLPGSFEEASVSFSGTPRSTGLMAGSRTPEIEEAQISATNQGTQPLDPMEAVKRLLSTNENMENLIRQQTELMSRLVKSTDDKFIELDTKVNSVDLKLGQIETLRFLESKLDTQIEDLHQIINLRSKIDPVPDTELRNAIAASEETLSTLVENSKNSLLKYVKKIESNIDSIKEDVTSSLKYTERHSDLSSRVQGLDNLLRGLDNKLNNVSMQFSDIEIQIDAMARTKVEPKSVELSSTVDDLKSLFNRSFDKVNDRLTELAAQYANDEFQSHIETKIETLVDVVHQLQSNIQFEGYKMKENDEYLNEILHNRSNRLFTPQKNHEGYHEYVNRIDMEVNLCFSPLEGGSEDEVKHHNLVMNKLKNAYRIHMSQWESNASNELNRDKKKGKAGPVPTKVFKDESITEPSRAEVKPQSSDKSSQATNTELGGNNIPPKEPPIVAQNPDDNPSSGSSSDSGPEDKNNYPKPNRFDSRFSRPINVSFNREATPGGDPTINDWIERIALEYQERAEFSLGGESPDDESRKIAKQMSISLPKTLYKGEDDLEAFETWFTLMVNYLRSTSVYGDKFKTHLMSMMTQFVGDNALNFVITIQKEIGSGSLRRDRFNKALLRGGVPHPNSFPEFIAALVRKFITHRAAEEASERFRRLRMKDDEDINGFVTRLERAMDHLITSPDRLTLNRLIRYAVKRPIWNKAVETYSIHPESSDTDLIINALAKAELSLRVSLHNIRSEDKANKADSSSNNNRQRSKKRYNDSKPSVRFQKVEEVVKHSDSPSKGNNNPNRFEKRTESTTKYINTPFPKRDGNPNTTSYKNNYNSSNYRNQNSNSRFQSTPYQGQNRPIRMNNMENTDNEQNNPTEGHSDKEDVTIAEDDSEDSYDPNLAQDWSESEQDDSDNHDSMNLNLMGYYESEEDELFFNSMSIVDDNDIEPQLAINATMAKEMLARDPTENTAVGKILIAAEAAKNKSKSLPPAMVNDGKFVYAPKGVTMPTRSKDERLCITILLEINGIKAYTLIDTGSEFDALSPDFVRACGIPVIKREKPLLVQLGAKGSRSQINYGAKATIQVDAFKNEHYFDVFNIDKYDAILGSPFLNMTNAITYNSMTNKKIEFMGVTIPAMGQRVRERTISYGQAKKQTRKSESSSLKTLKSDVTINSMNRID